jgi:hypothetical protein
MRSIKRLSAAILFSAVLFAPFADEKSIDSCVNRAPTNEFGFISPGINFTDLKDINNSLATLGLSSFPDQAWVLSFGSHTERGRWISEGVTTLRIFGDNLDSASRTSLYMGNISCYSGVNVLPIKLPINLYPYLGLGLGLTMLHIRSNERAMADLLASSEPNPFLWQVTGLLDLGVGSELKHSIKTGGLAIGLRMGYLVDLKKNKKWTADGTTVTGISPISQSGPYIRLVLGGWENRKKHEHSK